MVQRMSNSLIRGQRFSISPPYLSVSFCFSAAALLWDEKVQDESPRALEEKSLVIKLYCFHANVEPKANFSFLTAI